ncbi:MAG: hypothetical protein IKL84_00640 [Clostridia bacterium]|nr:hypothetical protein [Clostridia bacterium]
MKKLLFILALVLLLTGCAADLPAVEDVKPRLIELIEASWEINDIFFGEGLPAIARDSDYAKENHIYYMDEEGGNYDIVTPDCPYQSTSMIKDAAELVYSKTYLLSIYETMFVGVADENAGMLYARYLDTEAGLRKSNVHEPITTARRLYDYDSIEIVKPSNDQYINLEIDSHLEGQDEILRVRLTLVKEDGVWLLDSPTY